MKKEYKIKHTETLVGFYYVEAESEEDALDTFDWLVCDGKIDFGDLEMLNGENVIVREQEEADDKDNL